MSQHKSQQYDFPKQPWECLILNINNLIWKISVGMFDLVYLKFIHIFSFSLHRLVKSNHAETFHLKVFSLSPGGLKTWKFIIAKCEAVFARCGDSRLQWYHDLQSSYCSSTAELTTPVRSSALQKPFVEPPSPTFSSHVARPRKLFTFVYLKFDICGPVCGNRRRTTGERAVVTKGVKNRKGSKKRARQGPRVI